MPEFQELVARGSAAAGRLHAASTVVAADQPVSVLAGDVHDLLNLMARANFPTPEPAAPPAGGQ